ncbi:hypothetical protein SmJEL517_g00113 [Synchytrium microbalum]|uniref:Uncharacterized protein n=1 Tax=Synchytrium microbalum TaxID=1806994 RepID=A0A507CJ78_9FUNG|nr:uncharacterized protein SmJEL517_g00113 [Synchytrium microbalum]TPX38326.1 hypothetical protein SmJEL517_g00113 [Synchytrium microbalum]
MRATAVLLGASKRVLTPKDGNKNFYKGTGSGRMGHFVKGGKYVIDEWRLRTFVVPENLGNFKLRPYISPSTPKKTTIDTWTDTHSVLAYLTPSSIPQSILAAIPNQDEFVARCRAIATRDLELMRARVSDPTRGMKKWYFGPRGKRLPQWWHAWNPDPNEAKKDRETEE